MEKGVGSLGLFKVTDHVVRPEAVTGLEPFGAWWKALQLIGPPPTVYRKPTSPASKGL